MEYKIGEIFEYNGEWYQCVEQIGCDGCAFDTICDEINDITGNCTSGLRHDDKSVVFKKLEKVGEPFALGCGKWMQKYTCFMMRSKPSNLYSYYDSNGKFINIEIKQNKEDMEENNNAKHSNSESIGMILREFDLQKAREGKPVCTRDGRKARIICFDRKGDICPIIALIEENGMEVTKSYDKNGKANYKNADNYDLMMLSEKKEGWVNIDKGGSGKIAISSPYSTKEEAIYNDNETTIDTIKISWEE